MWLNVFKLYIIIIIVVVVVVVVIIIRFIITDYFIRNK